MYLYVYDSFLSEGKYEKELSEIENYLTDLGIAGIIERVSVFKSIKDILKSAVKKGAKTIVVVGDDNTFREAIKFIPDFSITFGFIPLGQPIYIARFLGIPRGVEACDTLSARIIEKIDVGKITTHQRISLRAGDPQGPEAASTDTDKNQRISATSKYFLGAVTIPKTLIKFNCDGKYSVSLKDVGDITICNTPFGEEMEEFSARGGLRSLASEKDALIDPRDGKLDVFISTFPSGVFGKVRGWFGGRADVLNQSHLIVDKIKIESENNITLFADKTKVENESFEIGLAKEDIRLIIGKDRLF